MAKVKIHTDELYEDTSTHDVYRRLLDGTYELVKVSGAALVTIADADGSVVVGALSSRFMQPVVQASAASANADEFYADATGVKWWRMKSSVAITSAEAIVAGQSTDNDAAGVKTLIDAVTTVTTGTWDAPTGAAHPGIVTLTLGETVTPWQKWDGTNRIKTIGIELTAAMAGQNVVLETVG